MASAVGDIAGRAGHGIVAKAVEGEKKEGSRHGRGRIGAIGGVKRGVWRIFAV